MGDSNNSQSSRQGDSPGTSSNDRQTFPAEKAYNLIRLEVLQETQQELTTWAKRRFAVLIISINAIIILFVGLGLGVWLPMKIEERVRKHVVQRVEQEVAPLKKDVRQAQKATTAAELVAATAKEKMGDAINLAETYREKAESYVKNIEEQSIQAQRVNLDLAALGNKLAETENQRIKIEKHMNVQTARIAELESLVNKLAQTSQENKKLAESYQKQLRKKMKAVRLEDKKFDENSQYIVNVFYYEGAQSLGAKAVEKLKSVGFKVNAWIVPATPVYKETLRDPQLKYTTPPIEANTLEYYGKQYKVKAQELRNLLQSLPKAKDLETVDAGDIESQVSAQQSTGARWVSTPGARWVSTPGARWVGPSSNEMIDRSKFYIGFPKVFNVFITL